MLLNDAYTGFNGMTRVLIELKGHGKLCNSRILVTCNPQLQSTGCVNRFTYQVPGSSVTKNEQIFYE